MRIEQPSISIAQTAGSTTIGNIIVPQTLFVTNVFNALSVTTSILVADAAYQITAVKAVWGVAGGLAAVLNVEKLTGTTAPGSGTALLSSDIDLTGAANTVNTGALTATAGNLQLAAGDRIGCKLGGTLTGLIGCVLTITLKRI